MFSITSSHLSQKHAPPGNPESCHLTGCYFNAEARLQAKHTLSGSDLSQRTMHRSSFNGADQSIPAHYICFICHEIMRGMGPVWPQNCLLVSPKNRRLCIQMSVIPKDLIVKPAELKPKVCTSVTSELLDLKSPVVAYRSRTAKMCLCPTNYEGKCT